MRSLPRIIRRRSGLMIGRQVGPPPRVALPQQERGHLLQLLLFGLILAALLAILFMLRLPSDFDLEVGTPSQILINAPRSVTYVSQIRTAAERDKAANDPANLAYTIDTGLLVEQQEELRSTLDAINRIRSNPSLSYEERLQQLQALPSLPISDTLATQVLSFTPEQWDLVRSRTWNLFTDTLRDHKFLIDEETLKTIKESYLPFNARLEAVPNGSDVVVYLVSAFLRVNRTLDVEETKRLQEAARQKVPEVTVTVQKDQNIIRQGDIVTPEHLEKLRALGLISPSLELQQIFGRSLLALMLALSFCIYLYFYGRPVWETARPLFVLGLLIVVAVVLAKILLPTRAGRPEAIPLAAFAMLATVVFGGQIGVMVAALLSLILGFLGDRSFSMAIIPFVGSLAGIFAIRRPDRSIRFLQAGLWVTGSALVVALALRLTEWSIPDRGEIIDIVTMSAFNGMASGLVALGTYHLVGRMAGKVTPIELLELAHPNQPLLRRLMQEAPGTYHHSVVISNLAENAAEAIGADSLLVRVGAYYHDIGKTLRPYFFTDNQHNRANVHESLDPKTSARLIADHVREGVKLARAHGLPQQIIDFIVQHHGTTVIKYFYQQALQRDDSADIDDYRYPGPKPQTKEAAILMLADGVEATVRSREQAGLLRPIRPEEDETAEVEGNGRSKGQTIEEVVEQIIKERLQSGELDECPLTLRDLTLIKQSFVKTLQGIYHPRVDYPNLIKQGGSNS